MAEFDALRSDILARTNAQFTLAGAGLTAVGVAVGVAFSEKGNAQVVIAVPFLSAAIILAYTFESMRVVYNRRIHTLQTVALAKQAACEEEALPSWEKYLSETGGRHRSILTSGLTEGALVGIFLIAGIVLAIWSPGVSVELKVSGCVAVVGATTVAGVMARATHRRLDQLGRAPESSTSV